MSWIIYSFASAGFVVFLANLLIALFIFFKNPTAKVNKLFSLFFASVSIYGLGFFRQALSSTPSQEMVSIKILLFGTILIPIFFVHATYTILNKKIYTPILYVIYTLGFIFEMLDIFTDLFARNPIPKFGLQYLFQAGPLYAALACEFAVGIIVSIWQLRVAYKISAGIDQNRYKYLFLGMLVGFAGGSPGFLLGYNINLFPINPITTYCVVLGNLLIFYAIVRHHLMDIEVVIKKTIVFTGLFVFIFGIIAATSFVLQTFLGKFIQINNWLSFGISAIVLLFLHDTVKGLLIRITDKFLFQKEYDYQQVLKEISRGMIGKVELEELKDFISSSLLTKMKLESADIIGKDEPRQLKAVVSIPIFLRDEEYWILSLGDKKSGKLYTKEDKNMLEALSHEISIAVENAINFQSLRESQLELMRQENLKFVSVLVKGLAHEIFNPLTPLQHSVEDLEGEEFVKIYEIFETYKDKFAKEDEQKFKEALLALRDATKSIKTNAQHIHLIVDTLNKMQKGDDKTIGPVDIKMFFKEVVTILSLEVDSATQKDVIIDQHIERGLLPVTGNPTLLKQIFINLYKNACYAMKNSAEKIITISCRMSETNGKELIIEFSDTGPGIPPQIMPKLFTYGATTKGAGGSGIGLNQCKAIIEKFGGSISVKSEVGKGAIFTIALPIWKETKNAG